MAIKAEHQSRDEKIAALTLMIQQERADKEAILEGLSIAAGGSEINSHASPFLPFKTEKDANEELRGQPVYGTDSSGQGYFEFLKSMQINPNDRIADISQFDSFMDRFKKGSPNPKYPSLNHHSPEAQKLILNTALRIRGV